MNQRRRRSAWACVPLALALYPAIAAPPHTVTAADAREMARATGALQQGDFKGAVDILESRMHGLAADAHALRMLGFAHLKLHEPEPAFDAFSKALALEPGNPQTLYDLGIAECQRGNAERAFAWLQRASATRRVDMSQLEVETDAELVRGDQRYAALLPRPADFAQPFVEDVKVLHEWDGEAAGDQFGWIARVIGDVDHDGFNDFVTSAPTKNIHGKMPGASTSTQGAAASSCGASMVPPATSSEAGSKARGMSTAMAFRT